MNFADVFMFGTIGFVMLAVAVYFAMRSKTSSTKTAFNHSARYRTQMNSFNRINFAEKWQAALIILIAFIVSLGIAAAFLKGDQYSKTTDTEIWNGAITGKKKEKVSCEHSYQCNCVESCSGSGSSQSCSTICQTCYDHSYDWDWDLHTTIGTITIDRIDRQGNNMPDRWKVAKKDEPVAQAHSFTNWVKAADQSLHHKDNQSLVNSYLDFIPKYPDDVYDYHRLNRVLAMQVPLTDIIKWNDDLSASLKTLGPMKQANIVLVFVKNSNQQVANAIITAWQGGKKNDVIIIVGTSEYPKIDWVFVHAWTDKELLKVQLRDSLFNLKTIEREPFIKIIHDTVYRGFERKPMVDYEYLKNDIQVSTWTLVFMFGLQILLAVGLYFGITHQKRSYY